MDKIRFLRGVWHKVAFWLPSEFYLKVEYYIALSKKLNFQSPKTFNEKLQWLKLYYNNPDCTIMVDKAKSKKYVADKIGQQYIIKTLGVWNNFDDINFDNLPNQFVLKTTHDSGGVVICKNKADFDIASAKKKLNISLKRNYYKASKEWPYKNVPHRILAEEYKEDESGFELKDYKIFCFSGKPSFIEVDYDRFTDHHRNIYSTQWDKLNFEIKFKSDHSKKISKPASLEKMIELAAALSEGLPHLRVDFYDINGQIFFGELTFFHGSGFEHFYPEEWNLKFGELLKLPKI